MESERIIVKICIDNDRSVKKRLVIPDSWGALLDAAKNKLSFSGDCVVTNLEGTVIEGTQLRVFVFSSRNNTRL